MSKPLQATIYFQKNVSVAERVFEPWPKQALTVFLQHLRKVAAVQTYQGLSDRELLERLHRERDETAFTVVIERHGPMVLGVMVSGVANFHDAEDACQATFWCWARSGFCSKEERSLSSWLHGVACRGGRNLTRIMRGERPAKWSRNTGAKGSAADVLLARVQAILDEGACSGCRNATPRVSADLCYSMHNAR